MRISTLSAWALVIVVAAGILPAATVQAELAAPGIQVFSIDRIIDYNKLASFHGLVLAVALPLTAIGLCLAVAAETYSRDTLRYCAVLALLVGAAVIVAAAVFTLAMKPFEPYSPSPLYSPNLLVFAEIPFSILLLASLASLALASRLRLIVILFGVPSIFALLIGLGLSAIMRTADADILYDTYYALAADHAFGVSIVLSTLGGLACWAAGADRQWRSVLCLLAAGAILVAGLAAVLVTSQIGLMGMPRKYADYPSAFAEPQKVLAIWWGIFGAVTLVVVGWLSALAITARAEPAPESAFD